MRKNRGKIALGILGTVAVLVIVVVLTMESAVSVASQDETGHGAPSGPHYTLNILGKDWGVDKEPIDCGEGHRIFVQLGQAEDLKKGKGRIQLPTDIYLTEGPEFAVLDCDGTDGSAELQLPDPDPGPSHPNCTAYGVYVRALGKPGGTADVNLCATYTDPCTGDVWVGCSPDMVSLVREKGQAKKASGSQKFQNVSQELLTICVEVCVDYNSVTEQCDQWEWQRLYIFDERLSGELWKYKSAGLKHAQIRFYAEEVDCSKKDDWGCP